MAEPPTERLAFLGMREQDEGTEIAPQRRNILESVQVVSRLSYQDGEEAGMYIHSLVASAWL